MPPDFAEDMARSRKFIPALKQIMAHSLIAEAPFEEDAERATDLIVLKLEAIRVACRIRRHTYLANYGDEFTIRSDRPYRGETELGKVLSGWGDYLIYGFADAEDKNLSAWLLGDLKVFRLWFHRETVKRNRGQQPGCELSNGDGSSRFRAFVVNQLPAEFVKARALERMAA